VQGVLGECYLLAALAALAEREERVRWVFGSQGFNPNGIYKLTLRVDGTVREVLVDDFVPVNGKGEPLFCQPNKN
jgi:calpain-15